MSNQRRSGIVKIKIAALGFIIISILINSCGIIKGLKVIKCKEIKPVYYNTNTKIIILVPLTHFGQPEYYADLTDSIRHWKRLGYRIYYEAFISDASDSLSFNTYERKWRRITGGIRVTAEEVEELKKVFKKGMVQPKYDDLGITKEDLVADVSLGEFLEKYEELYGVIELSPCDLSTPFDSTYSCYKPKNVMAKLEYLLVDFRNERVVDNIKLNNDPKIVVIYGKDHIKGILKLLKHSSI